MLRSLRIKLMLAGICSLVLLLIAAWGIAWGRYTLAGVMIVVTCFGVIALLLWFWRHVTDPIERVTDFANNIASGSYGSQMEISSDDEIGRLTQAINHISEQTAMAEKTRTEFISQVSHELRTPLTAITGWAETIAFDEAVQGDSLRGIQIISREAERLTGMVMELLEFTRIQDGRFNLRIELLDISAELEDALFTYGELMRQAGVELEYTPSETEIPLIPGDPERLKQVFLNLLDNASKHGGDGKQVDVSIKQKGESVWIAVRDHGRGIPEAELPHVKEKFYKGSSKNRGTGIGLAVCDEIVTRHGGELRVENAEGGGCRVTVILPVENK
ncbi:MAG: HAMP domain-containing protein [Oscillospiraceae bacterium]|nr:HAMP domain-containing protein [Oscillospiraceae bacterium]